jgi:hypothetical protein
VEEDGRAGLSEDNQKFCFAITLWNGVASMLKERPSGITNSEGNHRPRFNFCHALVSIHLSPAKNWDEKGGRWLYDMKNNSHRRLHG